MNWPLTASLVLFPTYSPLAFQAVGIPDYPTHSTFSFPAQAYIHAWTPISPHPHHHQRFSFSILFFFQSWAEGSSSMFSGQSHSHPQPRSSGSNHSLACSSRTHHLETASKYGLWLGLNTWVLGPTPPPCPSTLVKGDTITLLIDHCHGPQHTRVHTLSSPADEGQQKRKDDHSLALVSSISFHSLGKIKSILSPFWTTAFNISGKQFVPISFVWTGSKSSTNGISYLRKEESWERLSVPQERGQEGGRENKIISKPQN